MVSPGRPGDVGTWKSGKCFEDALPAVRGQAPTEGTWPNPSVLHAFSLGEEVDLQLLRQSQRHHYAQSTNLEFFSHKKATIMKKLV